MHVMNNRMVWSLIRFSLLFYFLSARQNFGVSQKHIFFTSFVKSTEYYIDWSQGLGFCLNQNNRKRTLCTVDVSKFHNYEEFVAISQKSLNGESVSFQRVNLCVKNFLNSSISFQLSHVALQPWPCIKTL